MRAAAASVNTRLEKLGTTERSVDASSKSRGAKRRGGAISDPFGARTSRGWARRLQGRHRRDPFLLEKARAGDRDNAGACRSALPSFDELTFCVLTSALASRICNECIATLVLCQVLGEHVESCWVAKISRYRQAAMEMGYAPRRCFGNIERTWWDATPLSTSSIFTCTTSLTRVDAQMCQRRAVSMRKYRVGARPVCGCTRRCRIASVRLF